MNDQLINSKNKFTITYNWGCMTYNLSGSIWMKWGGANSHTWNLYSVNNLFSFSFLLFPYVTFQLRKISQNNLQVLTWANLILKKTLLLFLTQLSKNLKWSPLKVEISKNLKFEKMYCLSNFFQNKHYWTHHGKTNITSN